MYRLSAWIEEGSGKSLKSRRVAWDVVMIPFLRSSTVSTHACIVSAWDVYPDRVVMDPEFGPEGRSDVEGICPLFIDMDCDVLYVMMYRWEVRLGTEEIWRDFQ